jgi:hypothetical protein
MNIQLAIMKPNYLDVYSKTFICLPLHSLPFVRVKEVLVNLFGWSSDLYT